MKKKLQKLCAISKDLHILYVEDDINVIKKTEAMFRNIFKNVTVSENGVKGWMQYNDYYIKNNRYFDIVVTDIKMPQMDGIMLSKKIKSLNKQQPIVVTSAHDDSQNLIEFINLGISKFIKKPFTFNNVIDTFLQIVLDLQMITQQQGIKIIDDYYWCIDEKILLKNNIEVKLTQNEIIILDILFKNRSQIFSNDDLYYTLQDDNFDKTLSEDSIKAILKRLRKKIPENLIVNIYAQGYKINTNQIMN